MTTVPQCEPVPVSGRPLLKWAGGKRQLLPSLRRYYPVAFTRYIEPFFGSGAVFFDLHAAGRLAGRQAWLVDDNADLVGCYKMLAWRTDEVIAHLRLLAAEHASRGSECYYEVRDTQFNPIRAASGTYTPELAAMLIYLNRTGFNGLFRLNKAGAFNVPAGRYVNPRIVDEAHLREVAAALRNRGVTLVHGSFDGALANAGRGDFIYCDPPYAPLSRTSCFANYTAKGFTLNDQARLQHALIAAAERGAAVVLSNSSAPDIERLYSTSEARGAQLRIERVAARRAINSRADSRGPVTELIVTNVAVPRSVGLRALRGNRPTTGKLRMAKAALDAGRVPASTELRANTAAGVGRVPASTELRANTATGVGRVPASSELRASRTRR